MEKLTPKQIKAAMPAVPDWRKQGTSLKRKFEFKDFVPAMTFVKKVARAAEAAKHHPDIDIRWNKVTLVLSTHSAGGLTKKDFDLARKVDGYVAG